MSVFLISTIELKSSEFGRFLEMMPDLVSAVEGAGWKLSNAFVQRTGRLNTVIDVWELENMEHFDKGLGALVGSPKFGAIKAVLDDAVVNETLIFAAKAPFAH